MATAVNTSVSNILESAPDSISEPKRNFQIVVAATSELGIGKDGKLPWKLPSDMKFFKDITLSTSVSQKKNAVIMGRRTWESIPLEFRPLSGRLNIVLSRSGSFDIATAENVVMCGSLGSALEMLAEPPYSLSIQKVFVIGGGQVYKEAFVAPNCEAIHLTEIQNKFDCDTFIPAIDSSVYRPWYSSFPSVEKDIHHCFTTYVRIREPKKADSSTTENGSKDLNSYKVSEHHQYRFLPKFIFERHEEYHYLRLVQDIISDGIEKGDRTGTGTLSKFGCQMRFNLRRTFPLLTTKRVFWRAVVEELLWFISGSTNAKVILVADDFGGACISYVMESFPSKVSKAVFISATMVTDGQRAYDILAQEASNPDSLLQKAQKFIYSNGNTNPPTAIELDKDLLADVIFNHNPSKGQSLKERSLAGENDCT